MLFIYIHMTNREFGVPELEGDSFCSDFVLVFSFLGFFFPTFLDLDTNFVVSHRDKYKSKIHQIGHF